MTTSLRSLNEERRGKHLKDPAAENVLEAVNRALVEVEQARYEEREERFATIFVFGVPRSGTTLLAQLVAHCLDASYITNVAARFYLVPVIGLALSDQLLGENRSTDWQSRFAATSELGDIHEFGYFWRHWLRKEELTDFADPAAAEQHIDWTGLRRTLLNIQHHAGSSVIYKNFYGAYHIGRLLELMPGSCFIYAERDPVDSAISILRAREQYYRDPSLWWSTVPTTYRELEGMPPEQQVAGQVAHLRAYYEQQIAEAPAGRVLRVAYRDVCADPKAVLEGLSSGIAQATGHAVPLVGEPPARFELRSHLEDPELRQRMSDHLAGFFG